MTFEEFCSLVKDNIKDYLPRSYADAEVSVQEVVKLNESYPGLSVKREGETVFSTINLKDLYQRVKAGTELTYLMPDIADAVLSQPPKEMAPEALLDYRAAKEHLIIRVNEYERNKEVAGNVPHLIVEDLILTVHVCVGSQESAVVSAIVTNDLLDSFGITKEQLFEDAFISSEKNLPPTIQPMENALCKILGAESFYQLPKSFDEQLESFDLKSDMAVISNTDTINGASVLFYPGVMEKIGEHMGCDYFILPSSVHEMILLPDNGCFSLPDLESMVKEINRTEVSAKDRLSDTVYHFDANERVFEKASSFAERTEAVMAHGLPEHPGKEHRPDPGRDR